METDAPFQSLAPTFVIADPLQTPENSENSESIKPARPRSLPLPSLESINQALAFFQKQRPRKVVLTPIFKLSVNSVSKKDELLEAFRYNTHFAVRVLKVCAQEFKEDSSANKKPRREKAKGQLLIFRLLHQVLEEERKEFQLAKERGVANLEMLVSKRLQYGKLLGDVIAKHINGHHLIDEDNYFAAILREGVYLNCGRMLWMWSKHFLPDRSLSQELPTVESLQEAYSSWNTAYTNAINVTIRGTKFDGKKLRHIGKRELRWLLDRLLPSNEIARYVRYVRILLGMVSPISEQEWEEANLTEHPWRHRSHQQSALRQRRIDSRTPDTTGSRMLLQELDEEGLNRFYTDLLDMEEHHEEVDSILTAIDVILHTPLPSFPAVVRMALPENDPYREELEDGYVAALRWFNDPFPSNRSGKLWEDYSFGELAELEVEAKGRLIQAASALDLPKLFPLYWRKTMSPDQYDQDGNVTNKGNYSSFALLYDKVTSEYVLALKTRGKALPAHHKQPKSKKHQSASEVETIGKNLAFVAYPRASFDPGKRAARRLMKFSLLYAKEFQDEKYIAPLIQRQLLAQVPFFEPQPSTPAIEGDELADDVVSSKDPEIEDSVEEAAPEDETAEDMDEKEGDAAKRRRRPRVPIGSMTLTCRWDEKAKEPEFYAHIPVSLPIPACEVLPQLVLGIHEHNSGYTYALLSFTGEVLKLGDLEINADVLPREGEASYNPNYANEVVAAILRLLKNLQKEGYRETVYIGFQDVSLGRTPSISRTKNRRTFKRPSQRIFDILSYKLLLIGNLPPRHTSQVSVHCDCSRCGIKLDESESAIQRVVYVQCLKCRHHQPYQKDEDMVQECVRCQCCWRAKHGWVEREFLCPVCPEAQPVIARHNTAIVVAQRTLQQLTEHHRRWMNKID